jgi:copper chaperone NosL
MVRIQKQNCSKIGQYFAAVLIGFLGLLTSCSQKAEPDPITFGKDICAECKMTLTDQRFGAEVITSKRKVFKFDSLECVDRHLQKYQIKSSSQGLKGTKQPDDDQTYIFVINATSPGNLILASTAHFIVKESLRSPMGRGFLASNDSEKLLKEYQPEQKMILNWDQIINELRILKK